MKERGDRLVSVSGVSRNYRELQGPFLLEIGVRQILNMFLGRPFSSEFCISFLVNLSLKDLIIV